MDNPNVSISDLFAGVREGLEKYQQKQKIYRPPKRSHSTSTADDEPISFRSLLEPAHVQSQDHSKNDIPIETSSDGAPDDVESKPLLLESHLSSNLKSDVRSSKPECVPLSELRRREAVSAALRASMRKITAPQQTFKPLSWNQPSFHVASNSDSNTTKSGTLKCDGESSCSNQTGKRKKCSFSTCDAPAPIANYCGLETIMPRPLGAPPSSYSGEGGVTTRSINVYGNHFPPYRRKPKWTKGEIDGLLELAQRITPDMNPKRRKE
eukprot:CAMPEP_0196136124 /NCGR_PEP_ID=MMETSP0910-20130528/4540_1 /TAXON_ID=49265 /ORGANISM="Thalassiosira rotula, Strain GSO102" /LENGTH=265 /DNA_ID=CAMNT_0041396365 /DNA_START=95 /DNA_END=892 /DNA_ORIENTATION=-